MEDPAVNTSGGLSPDVNLQMSGYLRVLSEIQGAVQVSTGCFVILLNSLTILAVHINRNLHTISNLYLRNLAVANILVGLNELIYVVTLKKMNPCNQLGITFLLFAYTFTQQGSFGATFLVGLDRYLAIHDPLHYIERMTSRKVRLYSIINWIITFLLACISFVRLAKIPHFICVVENSAEAMLSFIQFSCSYFLVGITLLIMYSHIWVTAQQQRKKVAGFQLTELSHTTVGTRHNLARSKELQAGIKPKRGMCKASKLVLGVILNHLLAWAPACIFFTCYIVLDLNSTMPLVEQAVLIRYMMLLGSGSSCINTLIYAGNNVEFRRTYKAILMCRWKM